MQIRDARVAKERIKWTWRSRNVLRKQETDMTVNQEEGNEITLVQPGMKSRIRIHAVGR